MLLLLFSAGNTRFSIRAKEIIEVLPLLELKPLLGVPEFVVGLCNYRNTFVPIIDLNLLLHQQPSSQFMTTRILMVNYPLDNGDSMTLGILVEELTESIKKQPSDFSNSGIYPVEKPFLGSLIFKDGEEIVHLIDVEQLLDHDVRELVLKSAKMEVEHG